MSAATPSADRDERGRFAPGNPGGPGNPFGRLMAELRTCVVKAFTPEKMSALAEVLVDRALKGDMAAARLMLAYAVGKPTTAVDPDRLDMEEWKQLKEETGALAELPGIVAGVGVAVPLTVLRAARPEVELAFRQQAKEVLLAPATDVLPPIVPLENGENPRVPPSPNGGNGAPAGAFQRHGKHGKRRRKQRCGRCHARDAVNAADIGRTANPSESAA